MANEFKIRRGQVFYVTMSDQCVPYIVLSNNKCNVNATMIHAAPVKQGQPDPEKYYNIPYISTCGRCKYVDVGLTQLMSKSMFEESKYSAAESYYTVNNKELMEGIADALCVHLGIHRNYVVYNEDPVQEEKKEPINITINLAGLPSVTAQVTETKEVQINPETVSSSIETVTEMAKEPVKFTTIEGPFQWTVSNTITSKTETINTKSTSDTNTLLTKAKETEKRCKKEKLTGAEDRPKSGDPNRKRFSDEDNDIIKKFIKHNHSVFGGTMSTYTIAKELNISPTTVTRRIAELKNQGNEYFNVRTKQKRKFNGHRTKHTRQMTEERISKLVQDYTRFGADYVLNNYNEFEFKWQVHDFMTHCTEKVK